MRCRLEGADRSEQQCAIEGGDEDSVSKLAGREAVASEAERGDTAVSLREEDRAETK
jgi:hypothetical protein